MTKDTPTLEHHVCDHPDITANFPPEDSPEVIARIEDLVAKFERKANTGRYSDSQHREDGVSDHMRIPPHTDIV